MDKSLKQLLDGDVAKGMASLMTDLKSLRASCHPKEWQAFTKAGLMDHQLTQVIYQDPFTRHSFERPRGYAGDAQLLDYIYGLRHPPDDTTQLGQEICKYIVGMAIVPRSIRARLDILAKMIDQVVDQTPHPVHILSIACGHLRESQKSKAIQSGDIGKLIALDQDALSLEIVNRDVPHSFLETIQSSVTSIIRQRQSFKDLDLVYASGLYDYLNQPFATRLTTLMFNMLRPGGRLLVANLVPNHNQIGYMETFMRWNLIYRTQNQLEDVASEIPCTQIASRRCFFEKHEKVVFLEVVKA